jgi:hypothetical protein
VYYSIPDLGSVSRQQLSLFMECYFKFDILFLPLTVGYMNPSGQWEEYPHYVSMEGLHSVSPVSSWNC